MAYSLLFLSSMGCISILLVLAGDIDFVFIPQGCVFSTLDASLDKLFGILMFSLWYCYFSHLGIVGYVSPLLGSFLYLSPLASGMTYSQDYVHVTFDLLLNIKEHLFFFMKKCYKFLANDFIIYLEIRKLGL